MSLTAPPGCTEWVVRFELTLFTDHPLHQFFQLGLVIGMNPLEQFFESGQTIPWIETLNAVAFLGRMVDTYFRTPCPASRPAEFLRICQIRFALPQRFFRSPVVRDVRHRAHESERRPSSVEGRPTTWRSPDIFIRHQQSMFESELRPLTRSTLNESLDSLSVIRMGSLHNKNSRYLCLRIEFKYSKGFFRPVDLSA